MFSAWVCKNINMKYSFIYFIEGIVLFTLLPISVLFVIHIDNGLMGKIIMCYIKKYCYSSMKRMYTAQLSQCFMMVQKE